MLSLEWTFDKGTSGFIANQKVKISREIMDKEHFLVCQSCQTASTPGVRLTDVVLPATSNEYCMEVDGFANNKKSFLWVKNEQGHRLIQPFAYLPELTKKLKPVVAPFKIKTKQNLSRGATDQLLHNLTIGILIGGDEQPTLNDMFFIKRIRIYERPLSHNHTVLEVPQITRIYNSRKELEEEVIPKRDDASPMNVGEYALIKCTNNASGGTYSENGNLFVAYSDNTNIRLRYLCNALENNQNVIGHMLTQAIQLDTDRIIPIYDDPNKAAADAENVDTFYDPNIKTQKIDSIDKNKKLLLYLDDKGYVRWIRPQDRLLVQQVRPTSIDTSIVEIAVSEVEINQLENLIKLGTSENHVDNLASDVVI